MTANEYSDPDDDSNTATGIESDTENHADAIARYPRLKARTQRFSLGAPRTPDVAGDGMRALFLRSRGPEDATTCLWVSWFDAIGEHHETLLADPRDLLARAGSDAEGRSNGVPDEEKARRERARESAEGIVSYSVDESGDRVVFTVGGRLWLTMIGDEENPADGDGTSGGSAGSDGSGSGPGTAARPEAAPVSVTVRDGELHAITRELGDTWYVSAMKYSGHPGRLFRPVLNPRISPDGKLVAYTTGRMINLVVIGENGRPDDERSVCGIADKPNMTVGLAEFAAGEEMDRYEGFWWSPDSRSLLIECADESPEPVWYIADPSDPTKPAQPRHYPQALTRNAEVRLFRFDIGSASRRGGSMAYASVLDLPEVWWDRHGYEYLADVHWSRGGDPILLVQNRRQTADQVLRIDEEGSNPNVGYASQRGVLDGFALEADGGALAAEESRHRWLPTTTLTVTGSRFWLDLIHGCPAWTPNGQLITAMPDEETDTMRLAVNGHAFTPAGWQVLDVLDVTDHDVLARATCDARGVDVVSFPLPDDEQELLGSYWQEVNSEGHGGARISGGFGNSFAADGNGDGAAGGSPRPIVLNPEPGVWSASRNGDGLVLFGRTMSSAESVMIHTFGTLCDGGPRFRAKIANHAETPGFVPNVKFVRLGERRIHATITLPSAGSPYANAEKLPVLMKPYGGPMHREVMFSQSMYWDSQWWADQGFIVVAADGRGTGARGLRWDHEIFERFAEVSLQDQVDAVQALPGVMSDLVVADFRDAMPGGDDVHGDDGDANLTVPQPDLDRVAMIGWSYGGFLSALSVLREPDVFHAACAGAPPTDWTLYDTHYTERYLGLNPVVYERNSIIADAPNLRRPLLLIHGFADDNVTVANTLRLSSALLAAGREHTVLPLTGITHMTNDETVAENLLLFQRDFLRKALAD
ncbi:cytochrome C [Bifidobacterium margollesii]|uniref:Cytochrome C n=1 Tax=Bifidobacterium margollesii TaxID=2020964 RepID=A0A2N5JCE6_9BIFI|nr:prolyl oligopeptidase family serine peptidase [Bifidobacterium margollesii]PLS31859.1 cytochrome C [Bifidobacterium margollesii]